MPSLGTQHLLSTCYVAAISLGTRRTEGNKIQLINQSVLIETCYLLAMVIGPGYTTVKGYVVQTTGREANRNLNIMKWGKK